jgi:hypothetical protein
MHYQQELLKRALVALDDSIDNVKNCLNNLQHGKGHAKYDRQIAVLEKQIKYHEDVSRDILESIK